MTSGGCAELRARVPEIEIVFVVHRADICFGDALVGSDQRSHAAVKPDHGFLHKRATVPAHKI
jgi:hypothetical protein